MKKLLLILFLSLSINSFGQLAENSWSFGFGFTFPRFQASDVRPLDENYGGYLSLQRNFSEHVAFKGIGYFNSIKGRIPGNTYFYSDGTLIPSSTEDITSTVMGFDLNMMYYLSPCSPVSPYFYFGLGLMNADPDWGDIPNASAKSKVSADINFGFGAEWVLSSNWNLVTDFGYHTVDSGLDGIVNNNREGMFGSNGDAFITVNFGLNYYFSKGEPSKYCQLYSGITADTAPVDYKRIEEIVEKHIPKEITKEVVVEKQVNFGKDNKWVLVGVEFDFNSDKLKPEAYPVLFHAVQVMLQNPDMKVEIQGHTDNVGSEKGNMKISQRRAQRVKNYLVARGVEEHRLKAVGYGETNPITDNKTKESRAMNRRIEFKLVK
ncbi:MAG: OmpA family protein [Melioribacteraceae bacterium]|nr:OmpA family protein [Melioribacteraceae bacterium]